MGDLFPPEERSKLSGWLGVAMGLGITIGQGIGKIIFVKSNIAVTFVILILPYVILLLPYVIAVCNYNIAVCNRRM